MYNSQLLHSLLALSPRLIAQYYSFIKRETVIPDAVFTFRI